jgi:hypothetical protein
MKPSYSTIPASVHPGSDKTVKACLCLNCLEFDVIEIRIMEMLPKPEEGMDWMMRNIPSRLAKFSF